MKSSWALFGLLAASILGSVAIVASFPAHTREAILEQKDCRGSEPGYNSITWIVIIENGELNAHQTGDLAKTRYESENPGKSGKQARVGKWGIDCAEFEHAGEMRVGVKRTRVTLEGAPLQTYFCYVVFGKIRCK